MRKLIVPLAALALVGCSSGATRTISGQLDLTQMRPVSAQVIARSSLGHVYRAPIAADGSFRISLPVNTTYTVRFANATTMAKRFDAFATLAARRPIGASHWFTLTPGANITLSRVARVGVARVVHTSPIAITSDSGDDGKESADKGEKEDDGAEACDLENGKDDADVESDHDVNDDVDSDHDGVADSKDDHDDRATCASKSDDGDKCDLDDGEKKELDDDADKPCSGGGGGDGGAITNPPAVPGLI
jgi:hypothetical protein